MSPDQDLIEGHCPVCNSANIRKHQGKWWCEHCQELTIPMMTPTETIRATIKDLRLSERAMERARKAVERTTVAARTAQTHFAAEVERHLALVSAYQKGMDPEA